MKDMTNCIIKAFSKNSEWRKLDNKIICSKIEKESKLVLPSNDIDFDEDENWLCINDIGFGSFMLFKQLALVIVHKDSLDNFLKNDWLDKVHYETIEDSAKNEWKIDLKKLNELKIPFSWNVSEDAVDKNCFSIDDFYYATV